MYRFNFTNEGNKSLSNLPFEIISRIKTKIIWLAENASIIPHLKLKGDEFKNMYKLRIGDYRIIYELDNPNKLITIIKVGHRKNIYKI